MREIPLTQGKVARIDDDDYQELSKFKWYAKIEGTNVYAAMHRNNRDGKLTTIRMHRLILKTAGNKICDHIDGNGLNNQRSNLRIVSKRINNQNKQVHRNGKICGVRVDKRSKVRPFVSHIRINGHDTYLGCYPTLEEASYIHNLACAICEGSL